MLLPPRDAQVSAPKMILSEYIRKHFPITVDKQSVAELPSIECDVRGFPCVHAQVCACERERRRAGGMKWLCRQGGLAGLPLPRQGVPLLCPGR